MSRLPKLVYFGTDDFSIPALRYLITAGWPVSAVVTKPDSRSGRGQKLTPPKVKQEAIRYKIKVFQPAKPAKVVFQLASLEAEVAVLASYGKILPQSMLDIFPAGIVNIHPSMLPRWRGASPIESAILAGDEQTAISLMKLTAGMDEGPIYAQKEVVLTGEETGPTLSAHLAETGAKFLIQKLPLIIDGSLTPHHQDDSKASYAPMLKKDDGLIDWSKSAIEYERQVRAFLEFPRSRGKVFGKEVVITKSRIAKNERDGQLVLECQPGYLEILELIGPSGKTMSGVEFLQGYNK